ncbi:MAG: hypothetical protein ABSC55_22990 [Syntrophorhabdales bacterium]
MRGLKILVLVALIVGLLTPGMTFAQAAKFKIGCALPLTGAFGKDGNLVKDAYSYWADTINARGGLTIRGKKYPVELLFFDDRQEISGRAALLR